MTFPIDPTIFGAEISTHLVTEILAFLIGYRLYLFKKKGINDVFSVEQRLIILIAAAAGALIFSRLIAALENPIAWFNSENSWLYLYGTKTVVGGFLGGWLFVEITKKIIKVKGSSGDVMTYPIIMALIIGRIGCFSQGINEMTYGYPTEWITGMDLGDGLLRHPLALYEMVILSLIWLILFISQRKKRFNDGLQFKYFMFIYLAYRFIAEWMKPHFPLYLGLTSIQIAIIMAYLLNLRTFINCIPSKQKSNG